MDTLNGAFNNIEDRLIDLGTAGALAGKIVNIVVIFSAKMVDSYTYFQTHTFQEAYDKVVTSFNAASFTGKANINLMGWNVYGYQQAQSLVPAPVLVKAEGGCFANQQFITIGGTDDLLFTGQTYNVQWSPTGLGTWTNIGTVASVAGVMADADYNVGVGNAEAGNTLDFRFEHSTIPEIVSNIITEIMPGAC